MIEYAAPQIARRDKPFHSEIRDHSKGQTQALEDLAAELLARGLSVRDIEDAFQDESGRQLLSRARYRKTIKVFSRISADQSVLTNLSGISVIVFERHLNISTDY